MIGGKVATEPKRIVTLLTDFGVQDPYVGIMKGVILSLWNAPTFVDLTHQVSRQCVSEGALFLGNSWRYFPAGTVHLAVVDPGVGGKRKALVVEAGGHFFVGPDNGLLESAIADPSASIFEVQGSTYTLADPSNTFHGRDVFAPVVGHLLRGICPSDFGPRVQPQRLSIEGPQEKGHQLIGQIVSIDVFGNLITNIPGDVARKWLVGGGHVVLPKGKVAGLSQTYGDVPISKALALIGSTGVLEISIHGGSARACLGGGIGERVRLVCGVS